MGRPLRVLIIEDYDDDALLIVRELQRGGYEVEFERVETAEVMQSALAQKTWDLILSDYSLPQFNALQALAVLKASGLDVPFIIVSGTIGEETAVTALKAGANDFLIKGNFARLGPAIERELREAESRRERRQMEEKLIGSELGYRRLFEAARDGILILDAETGRIIDVNPYLIEMLGFSQEEIYGKELWELGFFKDIAESRANFLELQQKEYIRYEDLPLETVNGRRFNVEFVSNVYQVGHHKVIQCNIRDITERKQTEATLNQQRRTYQTLLNAMSELGNGVAVANDKARLVFVNQAFCTIVGYTTEELLNIPSTWDLIRPEDLGVLQTRFQQRVRGEPVPNYSDLTIIRKDGLRVTVEMAIQSLSDNEEFKFIIIARDITERKQAEDVLRAKNEEIKVMTQQVWQAAKLATMGELAASIAHELNNPLATISLRTEMLLAQFSPNAPQSRSLQIIDSEIKRMAALVANLLQFSRRSSSQISTLDVREEIANTLELIHYHLRKSNILTVQELSPETPLVQVDRQQLRQVFLNLFTNAADAMPQGGTLTIRTWPGEKPDLHTTAPQRLTATPSLGLPVSKLPQVLIEVSDTGEGIPPERFDEVWEPFYTTKPGGKGTGLGLAICRRIIQEHGGTIEIVSDAVLGKGTTVRITLPAVKDR
jgi:PAS domain S-box-containing protein